MKDNLAMRHVKNMVPTLHLKDNAPIARIDFTDTSSIEFDLRLGSQIPRCLDKDSSHAKKFLKDLKSLDMTKENCDFNLKDGSAFSIPLSQFPIQW